MGKDKRKLQWDGVAFLDKISQIMARLFNEVIVVTAERDYDCSHLPVRVVTDRILHKGSLGGLYTGIAEAHNYLSFAVACDMPFLVEESIGLICMDPPSDISVVKLNNTFQPLHARYSKRCVPVIEHMIKEGNLKIQHLFSSTELDIHVIDSKSFKDSDPSQISFHNINTPADLELARKRVSNQFPSQ